MTYFDNYIISIERIQYGVRHNKEYFIKFSGNLLCPATLGNDRARHNQCIGCVGLWWFEN